MIQAHLNGGPKDDEYVVLQFPILHILRLETALTGRWADATSCEPVVTRDGTYLRRLDSLGQAVPHDLTGIEEFDWRGWS